MPRPRLDAASAFREHPATISSMPQTPPPPESPPPQRPLAYDGVAAPSSAEGILPQTTERLPATVRALGWTSFLTDLSSEAIYPLLPGFVIRELGGTAMNVGMIDGVANGIAAIVRLPAGAISDTLGRRPLVLVGYGLSAIIRPLMGLATSPLAVLFIRAADRFGKGIRSAPRDALVTDLVAPSIRGRAFGHIRAMDHLGAAIGPLLAMAYLFFFPGQERALFLLALLPGLVTLAVVARFVKDPPRNRAPAAKPILASRLTLPQGMLLSSVAVWALAASSEQFLLLRAGDLGTPAWLIPAVWFGVGLCKSAAAKGAGPIVDRLSPKRALAAGWALFAIAYGGLSVAGHLAVMLPLLALVAAAYGLIEPAERALVANLAPAGRQGSSFGWYTLVQGLMGVPAGLLTGWLWQRGGSGAPVAFATTAGLSLIHI